MRRALRFAAEVFLVALVVGQVLARPFAPYVRFVKPSMILETQLPLGLS